jgi:hypothetical protein
MSRSAEALGRSEWIYGLLRIRGIRGIVYRVAQAWDHGRSVGRQVTDAAVLRTMRASFPERVTAVVVGRNDDYMPDFLGRLRATLRWNLRHLVTEVVFVEWNPPADQPLLSPVLAREFPTLRAYVVPGSVHDGICENPNLKLLEYHAKNVGIRRAAAPWVLVTNGDAAVGLDSVRRLREEGLAENVVWTAERRDVSWPDEGRSVIGFINAVRPGRTIPYNPLGTGEFALASRALWHHVGGYDEGLIRHRIGCDARGVAQMIAHGATARRVGSVIHLQHGTSCTVEAGPHQGEAATPEGVPYSNATDWGLAGAAESAIEERVWELHPRLNPTQ